MFFNYLENGSNNLIEMLKQGRIFIAIFKAIIASSDKKLLGIACLNVNQFNPM